MYDITYIIMVIEIASHTTYACTALKCDNANCKMSITHEHAYLQYIIHMVYMQE